MIHLDNFDHTDPYYKTTSEFKILVGTPTDVQKTLNQWRHQYGLMIDPIGYNQQDEYKTVALLVLRGRKANYD